MTHEKMTVHRALAELKTMDARIDSAIRSTTYVLAVKRSAEKINGVKIDTFKDAMKANNQKVNDLIRRRNAMKRAVVLSNATTKVTVGGKEYTVAEAIECKTHGVEYMKALKNSMTSAYLAAQAEMKRNDDEVLEKRAEQYVLSVIAAQPKDAKMSVDSEAMKALRKSYIENNAFEMLDPLGVAERIAELDEMIHAFEADVDAALSCSNALTVIEFEY